MWTVIIVMIAFAVGFYFGIAIMCVMSYTGHQDDCTDCQIRHQGRL